MTAPFAHVQWAYADLTGRFKLALDTRDPDQNMHAILQEWLRLTKTTDAANPSVRDIDSKDDNWNYERFCLFPSYITFIGFDMADDNDVSFVVNLTGAL